MKMDRATLLVIAGFVIGLLFAASADDALLGDQIKAGAFERHGVAYHVETLK